MYMDIMNSPDKSKTAIPGRTAIGDPLSVRRANRCRVTEADLIQRGDDQIRSSTAKVGFDTFHLLPLSNGTTARCFRTFFASKRINLY